jgi:membrane fusion protein, multidrug efflux system
MKIEPDTLPTTMIPGSNANTIVIRGYDLVGELIGKISFTDHAWLLVKGNMPNAALRRILDDLGPPDQMALDLRGGRSNSRSGRGASPPRISPDALSAALAPERPAAPSGERPPPPLETPGGGEPGRGLGREVGKHGSRRRLVWAFALLFVMGVGPAGYLYWDDAAHFESTDDAFIAARQFSVAPHVAGYITAVPVTDNEHVVTGQVIARIDPRDYQTTLEQAEAQVAAAHASVRNVDAQMNVQQAQISANQAQVDQVQANLKLAQVTWGRDRPLVHQGWATAQQGTIDVQNLKAQRAAVENAQATLKLAQRQMETLQAQRASDEANVKQAEAQRDQAQLNVSYTTVVADQPGRIVDLTAAVGEYVSAGTALSMFVPDDIWVTANYKETQLNHMRPGQLATIEIDAYPDRDFRGHVASVQPGSGTAFSLLPAENATGNYVKIVQRVPVKIIIDNPPTDVALGPGMSVEPTVRVDPAPSLLERLEARFSSAV